MSNTNERSKTGVLVFALGFGSSVSALSLVSHWIPDGDRPTFYAAVVVLQSLGHAIGDPGLMMVYSWGLGRRGGGGWEGWEASPFFAVSVSSKSLYSKLFCVAKKRMRRWLLICSLGTICFGRSFGMFNTPGKK